ncbi:MAG: RNA-directed DNA polymerase [Pseudomonadota bacterium]
MAGRMPVGRFKAFEIHDPKQRVIHAAPLWDRVAHHALVRHVEPRLERALLPSVFACRVGKGVHAALDHAQRNSRRFAWVMHADIAQYFPSIDHLTLHSQLRRRFRGDGCALLAAAIDAHGARLGRGLPIGALTSQHFANHYLNDADRWCLAQPGVRAHCRYMDDFLLWSHDRQALLDVQVRFADYLGDTLGLSLKPPLIQRSWVGVRFCGITVKPHALRLGLRRKRRFRAGIAHIEAAWLRGDINSATLQQRVTALHSALMPADSAEFRARFLASKESLDA